MNLETMTSEELSNLMMAISAERTRRSNTFVEVWNGRDGDVARRPPGGALLEVIDAIPQYSYDHWYPTRDAAIAALDAIAMQRGRVREPDGCFVDLTVVGCSTSYARVSD